MWSYFPAPPDSRGAYHWASSQLSPCFRSLKRWIVWLNPVQGQWFWKEAGLISPGWGQ